MYLRTNTLISVPADTNYNKYEKLYDDNNAKFHYIENSVNNFVDTCLCVFFLTLCLYIYMPNF